MYNINSEKMKFNEVIDDDNSDDVDRTVKILKDIANSIEEKLQFTYDHPGKHIDGKMPVFDTKIWINNDREIPTITHTFYNKECASEFTIMRRSAVSWKTKQSTYFQEVLGRLLHISPEQPWSESVNQLIKCFNMFRVSGYAENERLNFIKRCCGKIRRYEE